MTSTEVAANTGPSSSSSQASSEDADDDVAPPPVPSEQANVHLFVSNQSFDDPSVRLAVRIDGDVVVARDDAVEDQHDHVDHRLRLEPAGDEMTVSSASGLETTIAFEVVDDEGLWIVASYWWYAEEAGSGRIELDSYDEQVDVG